MSTAIAPRKPPNATLIMSMGMDPSSVSRLRDQMGRFARLNVSMREYAQWQLGLAAALYLRAVRAAFAEGKDKYGRSHNKTGYTLSTLQLHVHGMIAEMEMGGGGPFVRYGWTRGPIIAKPGGVLTFVDRDGARLFRKSVKGASYKGDDFPGRAAKRVDLSTMLNQIAYGVFHDVVGYAEDVHGDQYTGGQQLRGRGTLNPTGLGVMIR